MSLHWIVSILVLNGFLELQRFSCLIYVCHALASDVWLAQKYLSNGVLFDKSNWNSKSSSNSMEPAENRSLCGRDPISIVTRGFFKNDQIQIWVLSGYQAFAVVHEVFCLKFGLPISKITSSPGVLSIW